MEILAGLGIIILIAICILIIFIVFNRNDKTENRRIDNELTTEQLNRGRENIDHEI